MRPKGDEKLPKSSRTSVSLQEMQGRGRGSYLGLLLESGVGKSMVGSISNGNIASDIQHGVEAEEAAGQTTLSFGQNVSTSSTAVFSQESEQSVSDTSKKPTHSTWTSLDLLANRGRRRWHDKKDPDRTSPSNSRNDSDQQPSRQQEAPSAVNTSLTQSQAGSKEKSEVTESANQAKMVHLVSPQEFVSQSTGIDKPNVNLAIDSSSETSESTTSTSSSTYIPPHRRKGYDQNPEFYSESAIIKPRKVTSKQGNKEQLESTEPLDPQKIVESELSWQKWKLQRNFKKLLTNLSADNFTGFEKNFKDMVASSQLSTKFSGVSEMQIFLELLTGRVLEQKEKVDIAVQVCRLLNTLYPDELSPSLREVLKEYRKDAFGGVANKNSRCDNFCLFLKKLCDVAGEETRSFQDCVKQTVTGCLHDWISSFENVGRCSQEAEIKVVYLCDLLEFTKNAMASAKRSWIKSSLGKIRNCICSVKVTSTVRENLLDAVIKQLLQYPGTKETAESSDTVASDNVKTDCTLSGEPDLYKDVKKMLSELELYNLLGKFQDNLIRDTLLRAEKSELKSTLQEAGLAPGAILEIQRYLERNGLCTPDDVSEQLDNEQPVDRKQSPPASLDSNTRIRNLECDLQQLLKTSEDDPQEEEEKADKNIKDERVSSASHESKKIQHAGLREAQDELKDLQSSLKQVSMSMHSALSTRPPPGFSDLREQDRMTPSPTSSTGLFTMAEGRPTIEHSPVGKGKISKREVFPGEKKADEVGSRNKNNAEKETTNVHSVGDVQKQNLGDRNFSRHRGRGRARRDPGRYVETSRCRFPKSRDELGRRPGENYDQASDAVKVPPTRVGLSSSSGGFSSALGGLSLAGTGPASANDDTGRGSPRPAFGSSMPTGCFICGAKDHRSAYCKNNAAMFD